MYFQKVVLMHWDVPREKIDSLIYTLKGVIHQAYDAINIPNWKYSEYIVPTFIATIDVSKVLPEQASKKQIEEFVNNQVKYHGKDILVIADDSLDDLKYLYHTINTYIYAKVINISSSNFVYESFYYDVKNRLGTLMNILLWQTVQGNEVKSVVKTMVIRENTEQIKKIDLDKSNLRIQELLNEKGPKQCNFEVINAFYQISRIDKESIGVYADVLKYIGKNCDLVVLSINHITQLSNHIENTLKLFKIPVVHHNPIENDIPDYSVDLLHSLFQNIHLPQQFDVYEYGEEYGEVYVLGITDTKAHILLSTGDSKTIPIVLLQKNGKFVRSEPIAKDNKWFHETLQIKY